jgi:hypothetical protein
LLKHRGARANLLRQKIVFTNYRPLYAGCPAASAVPLTAVSRPFLPFRKPYFLDVSASRQIFRELDH